jgi:hypothetical protein
LTLTWNGGSNGNLSEEAWSGGVEGHLSPQDGDTLVFPKGGSFINDIDGLKVSALTFTSSAAVALAGEKVITVMGGGKVHTSGAGAVSISAPLQMGDGADVVAQGEDDLINPPAPVIIAAAGSGKKITISGVISGAAPIAVGSAKGTVEFAGNNTFTGKLSVTNGYFNATGKNALGAGEEEAYFKTGTGDGSAVICFYGVTVQMPVRVTAGNQSQEIKFAYFKDASGNVLSTVFKKNFIVTGSPQFYVHNWVTVTFSGKFQVSGNIQGTVGVGATMTFKGEGSSIGGYIVTALGKPPEDVNYKWPGKVVFDAPMTYTTVTDWHGFGVMLKGDYGVIKVSAENAFPHRNYGWNVLRFNKSNDGDKVECAIFDMNGKSQTFAYIRDDAKVQSNVIKSDSQSCVLRLMQNWTAVRAEKLNEDPNFHNVAPEEKLFNPAFHGEIRGKVSVSVEGSDSCYFAGPNTSTGSFSLTNAAY